MTFRGETFLWRPLRVINLPRTRQYYCGLPGSTIWKTGQKTCDGDGELWFRLHDDLVSPLGYDPWGADNYDRHTVVWLLGAGGYAGGAAFNSWGSYNPAGGAGFAILGDFNIRLMANAAFGWSWIGTNCSNVGSGLQAVCTQHAQRGTSGHEIGHGWRLPHSSCSLNSIMSCQYDNYPLTLLLDQYPWWEKQAVTESSFTSAWGLAPVKNLDANGICGGRIDVSWQNSGDGAWHFIEIARDSFYNLYLTYLTQAKTVPPSATSVSFTSVLGGHYYFVRDLEFSEDWIRFNEGWMDGWGQNNGSWVWVPPTC